MRTPAKGEIKKPHVPIMVQEVMEGLKIFPEGTYIDCTIGYGGHAKYILKQLSPKGELIGIDKDEEAIKYCKENLFSFKNLRLFHNSYDKIRNILSSSKIWEVNGMLLDLGLSSPQLDSNIRGFSYSINSDLDMRYDISQDYKASDILNTLSKKKIADIIYMYGEERRSRIIADRIHSMRPIQNVFGLVEAIRRSTPPKNRKKTLARVFQAIRIYVNNELSILEEFLSFFYNYLSVGGRIVFISFHSLEDRLVKHALRELSLKKVIKIVNKKPIVPTKKETVLNSRSRSAKLRIAEKIL